jgi:hypothetical protein
MGTHLPNYTSHSIHVIFIFSAVRTSSKNKWCLGLFLVLENSMFLVCHCTVTMLVFSLICKPCWPPVTVFMKLHENLFFSSSLVRLSVLHCLDSTVEGSLSQAASIMSFHTRLLSYPTWDTNSSFLQVEGSPRHLLQQMFAIFSENIPLKDSCPPHCCIFK